MKKRDNDSSRVSVYHLRSRNRPVVGKMVYDIFGNVVNNSSQTHIHLTIESIVWLVALIPKHK